MRFNYIKNKRTVSLSIALVLLLSLAAFSSCEISDSGTLIGEAEVEYSAVTPEPLRTLSVTPTPAPTPTPIPYDEGSVSKLITKGIYTFTIDTLGITGNESTIVPDDAADTPKQKFIVEKDERTGYCNIYSYDTGKYLGINMRGQDKPGESMSLTMIDVYSEVRVNWIIEASDDNKAIIRSAYSPGYTVTLVPGTVDEKGNESAPTIQLSAYTDSENQKWSIQPASYSEMLDINATDEFVSSLFKLDYVRLNANYADMIKQYGKVKSIFVKSQEPVLFEFERKPGVYYSFYGTVLTESVNSLEEYTNGYTTTPDKITTGHSNNDACTGVYYIPVDTVNIISPDGIKLSIAYTKSVVEDDFFEYCYSFKYDVYIVKIECDQNGIIKPGAKAIIIDKVR